MDMLSDLRQRAEDAKTVERSGHIPELGGRPLSALLLQSAAEIERLRAALKEIADMPPVMDTSGRIYNAEQRMARKALDHEQSAPKDRTVPCAQCETQVVFGACCPTCGKPTDE